MSIMFTPPRCPTTARAGSPVRALPWTHSPSAPRQLPSSPSCCRGGSRSSEPADRARQGPASPSLLRPPGAAARQQQVAARASGDAAGAPAPPPPPYSRLSVPVYSLATVGPEGGSATMNLMIYASPISLTPRHYAIGLYQGTLSRENMLATRRGVLQILGKQHAQLFQLLGKTSGREVDKLVRLRELGFETQEWRGVPTLADCCGLLELEFATEPYCAGDHDVAICRVVGYHTASAEAPPLSTGHLREIGLYK